MSMPWAETSAMANSQTWRPGPMERWVPRQRGQALKLGMRNLYILPSRFGWWWLAAALLLQLLGIQLQRNGPLLLSFLMLALALLALHLTHLNLQGLELSCAKAPEGFAGTVLAYPLLARSRCRREGLQLGFADEVQIRLPHLEAGELHLEVPWTPLQRGLQKPGLLRLQTTAPLGLFICWTLWHPPQPQLIYPARRRGPVALVLPPGEIGDRSAIGAGAEAALAGSADWQELAPHRPEEGPARLAWKQLARGRGRLSKRFTDPTPQPPVWLAPGAGLPLERALEHLSERISQLARGGEAYGLRLPDQTIPPDRGGRHRRRCLEALALCQNSPT